MALAAGLPSFVGTIGAPFVADEGGNGDDAEASGRAFPSSSATRCCAVVSDG
jgi:hypothetical protein